MNTQLIMSAISGLLSLAGVIVPLIPGNNSAAIGNIINTVKDIAPSVAELGEVGYQGIKNVIAALGSHPATTPEQMTDLAALDKTVDDAWAAVEPDFDPDYKPPGAA